MIGSWQRRNEVSKYAFGQNLFTHLMYSIKEITKSPIFGYHQIDPMGRGPLSLTNPAMYQMALFHLRPPSLFALMPIRRPIFLLVPTTFFHQPAHRHLPYHTPLWLKASHRLSTIGSQSSHPRRPYVRHPRQRASLPVASSPPSPGIMQNERDSVVAGRWATF